MEPTEGREDVRDAPVASRPPASDAPEHARDHALLRAAQAGDESAFATLVRRHQDRAWNVARNLVGDPEEARDLAQEAFLRVFKSLERFDFKHGFSTWLYRIVTNLCIDHLRKRRRTTSTTREDDEGPDLELVDEGVPDPSARLERGETAERVRAVIDRLAPHFRTVMVLRELEGLPCKEIAEIVGATHVTVRWRLHRGRKIFQEEWERWAGRPIPPPRDPVDANAPDPSAVEGDEDDR